MNLYRSLTRSSARSNWPTISFAQWANYFKYGGHAYELVGNQTLTGTVEEIEENFVGFVRQCYKQNGVVFACMLARLALFSAGRFQFQQFDSSSGRPGNIFGTKDLALFEKPWPGGTTQDLLARAIQDADIAGNSFFTVRGVGADKRLVRLRPDWVRIVRGLPNKEASGADIDAELIGYLFFAGGDMQSKPIALLPNEVAHFAPIPDPEATYRGMSWLTPIIREIIADKAMTDHKLKFIVNGATPNLIVKPPPTIKSEEDFQKWVGLFNEKHRGLDKAYETIFLAQGADATVIGANLKQIDFKVVQGGGETRVAAAAGVPAVLVGLSEGLAAATYSNFAQARRRFADGTMDHLWKNAAGSMSNIVPPPPGSQLIIDTRDVPFLREDQKDEAEIQIAQAGAIKLLVDSGFEPGSVVSAVTAGDLSRLSHTGLVSVQLLPPGSSNGPPKELPAGNGEGKSLAQQVIAQLLREE